MDGWFWDLDGRHVLYPPLYTIASLPMMLGPEARALSYLVPTKYLFLPYSQTQSSEIPFFNGSTNSHYSLDQPCAEPGRLGHKQRFPALLPLVTCIYFEFWLVPCDNFFPSHWPLVSNWFTARNRKAFYREVNNTLSDRGALLKISLDFSTAYFRKI